MKTLFSNWLDRRKPVSRYTDDHRSCLAPLVPLSILLIGLALSRDDANAQTSQVIGYWNFEGQSLTGKEGLPLRYASTETENASHLGMTSDLNLPDIDGQTSEVLFAPGLDSDQYGFLMPVPNLNNGGGTRLNAYTLIFDIYWLEGGPSYRSFIQIDSPENSNDGEFFLHDKGIGISGDYVGTVEDDRWYRITFSVTADQIDKYVDGIHAASQSSDGVDGRFALRPGEEALLFGDNSGEVGEAYVSAIQIRDRSLHYAEVAALGEPKAGGISTDTVLVEPNEGPILGQWDFTQGDFNATVGTALSTKDSSTLRQTQFGTTGELGLPPINGHEGHVLRAPGLDTETYGYRIPIPFAPNGGGNHLNTYTLIFDILWPESDKGFRSFIQIDDPTNDNDGEFFIRQNGAIGVSGDYDGEMEPDTWYRVAFVVTPETILKYVDGTLAGEQSGDGIDGRFAFRVASNALLFADDSGETDVAFLSSVQLQNRTLTPAELTALGGPDHRGIGENLPPIDAPATIVNAEYFIDTDPGEGLGTALMAGDGTFDTGTETVGVSGLNLSELTPGTHTLFVRYLNSENQWSEPISKPFTYVCEIRQRHIVAAEWFLGTDPGPGNGIPIPASDGVFDSDSESVGVTGYHFDGLEPGPHTIYVRYLDNENQWSDTVTTTFLYECGLKIILAAEYYLDLDPGEGQGTGLDALDGSFDSSQETVGVENLHLPDLEPGPHILYVRYYDSAGNWSDPLEASFIYQCDGMEVSIQILQIPGEGNFIITFPAKPGRIFIATTQDLNEEWISMEVFPELIEGGQSMRLSFAMDEQMRFFRIEFR